MNQPFSARVLMERLGTNANIPWTAAGMLAVILIYFSHGYVVHAIF